MRYTLSFLVMLTMVLAGSSCGERTDDVVGEAAGSSDSSRLVTLHADSFDAFLRDGGPVLIEFGGKRCIPCMEMRDILEEVGDLRPELRLGIVFWEDDPELFAQWKVPLIPAQIVFDGNRELTRHRGSWERDSLLAVIDRLFTSR